MTICHYIKATESPLSTGVYTVDLANYAAFIGRFKRWQKSERARLFLLDITNAIIDADWNVYTPLPYD